MAHCIFNFPKRLGFLKRDRFPLVGGFYFVKKTALFALKAKPNDTASFFKPDTVYPLSATGAGYLRQVFFI
jgi:hypothetical protein